MKDDLEFIRKRRESVDTETFSKNLQKKELEMGKVLCEMSADVIFERAQRE